MLDFKLLEDSSKYKYYSYISLYFIYLVRVYLSKKEDSSLREELPIISKSLSKLVEKLNTSTIEYIRDENTLKDSFNKKKLKKEELELKLEKNLTIYNSLVKDLSINIIEVLLKQPLE